MTQKENKIKNAVQFFSESKEEFKKITWPKRDEVTSYTIVVLITIIVLALFLWLIDSALMMLIQKVMN